MTPREDPTTGSPSPTTVSADHRISELQAELARCREELTRLKASSEGSTIGSSARHPETTKLPSSSSGPSLPRLPPYVAVQRRHTDQGGGSSGLRRRHSDDVPATSASLRDKFRHSLGLWFLLANQLHSIDLNDSGDASNHLATVSVANDGRSSVATAAAAAVSVALAKSWTGYGDTIPRTAGAANGQSSTLGSDGPPRTRFRLVAAIPKGPAKLLEAAEREERPKQDLKAETSIPLDLLDPTEESTSEWAAYGAHLKLQWLSKPKRVLVVFKLSHEAREAAVQAIRALLREGVYVYVEPAQHDAVRKILESAVENDTNDMERLLSWSANGAGGAGETRGIPEQLGSMLDVIFTVGGDGTVLWVCSLLGTVASVPPIVAISMGSLGFMTPFPASRLEKLCSSVISPDWELPLLLRHRLQCRIVRKKAGNGDGHDSAGDLTLADAADATIMVLNEVVIDRGMTASLTKLECYIDGNYVTVIQGDGLIVSTPTGSTAYNLAAGGSMVHPAVPCILFTPICPHTLSSRPLVFPEHVVMRLKVPADSRDDLSASFDGKSRTRLHPGDSVVVYSSQSPVPMVCHQDASHDFFSSVKEGLDWNRRVEQKGFPLGGL